MSKTVYKVYGISKWCGDISRNIQDIETFIGEEESLDRAEFLAAMFIAHTGAAHKNWLMSTKIVPEIV